MPLAAFQQNWLLWMTPEWGSKSDPKIGFADRASLVLHVGRAVPTGVAAMQRTGTDIQAPHSLFVLQPVGLKIPVAARR